ncbi:MAG: class I SAM-dependent methyltransferase [Candidatus Micrarchaeota archaeon]
MGWVIKRERPEEKYSLKEFYSSLESSSHFKSIKRIQERLTLRALDLLMLPLPARVLDAGCGNGFSARVMQKIGYDVVGVDASPEMLSRNKDLNLVLGDFTKRMPFKASEFNGIVSISAFQWVSANSEKTLSAAKEFRRLLKKNGKGVIQFYPKSEDEFIATGRVFKRVGFKVRLVTDSPASPKKRRVYLLFEK